MWVIPLNQVVPVLSCLTALAALSTSSGKGGAWQCGCGARRFAARTRNLDALPWNAPDVWLLAQMMHHL